MDSGLETVKRHLEESARVQLALKEQCAAEILGAARMIIEALRSGGKLLICGNGGSAADSQHFAAEMVGRFNRERGALPAQALSTDTSILTALGNDYAFEQIFSRQVEALGRPGDVLVCISTSGRSKNLQRAVQVAKRNEMTSIGLLGRGGGELRTLVDVAVIVPGDSTQRVQEGHISVIHVWCDLIESTLFPDSKLTHSN